MSEVRRVIETLIQDTGFRYRQEYPMPISVVRQVPVRTSRK